MNDFLKFASGWFSFFTLEDTVLIGLALYNIVKLLLDRQYKKLGQYAFEESMKLVNSVFTAKEKREKVVNLVYDKVPKSYKKIIKKDDVEKLVRSIYVTETKPVVDEFGLKESSQNSQTFNLEDLKSEMSDSIQEIINKKINEIVLENLSSLDTDKIKATE